MFMIGCGGAANPYPRGTMEDARAHGETLLTEYSAPIGLWQFGRDWTLVALSGEVPSEFVPLIQAAIGPESVWVAAYCNDTFGYLPTAKILREGGYETRGLIAETGFFSPQAEQVVVAKVRELAQNAGRVTP